MRHLILFCLLIPSLSFARVSPTPQGYDSHVVRAMYNPHDVIRVKIKKGIATLIQLAPNENILSEASGLGMGDSEAWGLSVRGNNIFLKPIEDRPSTNLTVVSNFGRTYIFDLVEDYHPYYFLQITYPQKKTKTVPTAPRYPCSQGTINWSFAKWGDNELSPANTWSDGTFTCMKFSKNTELPLIYKIDTDGQESLANFHVERDTVVVHSSAKEFRLRIGQKVLGVKTWKGNFGNYNDNRSTNNRQRHIRIGEEMKS